MSRPKLVSLRPMVGTRPVLWHIAISHYSEKARWALDYKGIEHERRAPTPGAHMLAALWLTRGRSKTFPVLQLEGQTIGELLGDRRRPGGPLPRAASLSRGSRRATEGAPARGLLRRGARAACPPSGLPLRDPRPGDRRSFHTGLAALPAARLERRAGRGDQVLLHLCRGALRGEERAGG